MAEVHVYVMESVVPQGCVAGSLEVCLAGFLAPWWTSWLLRKMVRLIVMPVTEHYLEGREREQ